MFRRFAIVLAVLPLLAVGAPAAAQSSRPLTLDEAVALARTRAAAVQLAALEVDIRDASLAQASAAQWPSLQFVTEGSQRYGLAFDQTAGQLTQETAEFAQAGIGASWTIFDGFGRRANLTGARADRDAAELRRVRAEQASVHDALRFYYDAATADATLEVVRADREAQQRQLAMVEAQIEGGIRPASEIFLQQERLAEAELRVLEAGRVLRGAELRLIRHLGLDPLEPISIAAPDTVLAPVDVRSEDMVDDALSRRPDLRAYRSALASAEADRRAARATYWPSLTLFGNLGTSYTSTRAIDFSSQVTDNRSGLLGLRVAVPLFDQGQTSARSRIAGARLRQLEVEVQDRRREVAVEVLEAAEELRVRHEEVHVAERRAAAARAFLEAERDRYEHGVSTLAALAEAGARDVDAQVRRVQARYALAVTRVLLEYRTGRLD